MLAIGAFPASKEVENEDDEDENDSQISEFGLSAVRHLDWTFANYPMALDEEDKRIKDFSSAAVCRLVWWFQGSIPDRSFGNYRLWEMRARSFLILPGQVIAILP